jgi:hypothetical protein
MLASQETPGKGRRAQEFIKAFNDGDATAVAGFWTPSGSYTDQVGNKHRAGRNSKRFMPRCSPKTKGPS